MSEFNVTVKEQKGYAILYTDGYINNLGGEKIADSCYELIDKQYKHFIINLEKSTIVNSIGISILIEIIEKIHDIEGSISFTELAPIVAKTFKIMGLVQYSTIYDNEEEAIAQVSQKVI